MIRKFAFFLPQFHEIKENNEWWGNGFTEWVNVKNAKPLFKNHLQPKIPIDGYYNLLDKETVISQTNLMNKYCIDGLIYYHYYFKGRKLLEKPAENLLKWKDINQHFFFCWANHSWKKTWNGTNKMLMEQEYGDENDWENHFNYLLDFFKDNRYEKIDNKPVLMIYNPNYPILKEIFNFFNKKCIENGFNGIIIINSNNNYIKDDYNYESYTFFREPTYCTSLYLNHNPIRVINRVKRFLSEHGVNVIRRYNGNKLINIACKKMIKSEKIIHGLFFEWDNTPRHSYRGYIISPISKESFIKYMNLIKDEKYVFINAWNEWSEGMMLEGTNENGYKYLEWIKEWSNDNN